MTKETGAAYVFESITYLKESSAKMLKIIFCLGIALIVSLAGNALQFFMEKEPVYFGLNEEMALLPMHPLHEPMVNEAALKSWASEAATDAFNMDFLDWRKQLSNSRKYFTPDAFKGFAQSLDKEGHIKTLEQYRSIMHGVPTGTPVITASGVLNGIRTWELEIPFMLNYETSDKTLASQQFFIKMRVRRVPTTEYPKGIAISQLTISRTGRSKR